MWYPYTQHLTTYQVGTISFTCVLSAYLVCIKMNQQSIERRAAEYVLLSSTLGRWWFVVVVVVAVVVAVVEVLMFVIHIVATRNQSLLCGHEEASIG